ncbi:MAG: 4Fe-4S ferredoxin [Chloroflexi bacterium HGW-Chloroflexi-10]|nr:MAG: 4Fe-4S ferredoxin [Chloroflexi bacterium HGW-Chloroflexi-10]
MPGKSNRFHLIASSTRKFYQAAKETPGYSLRDFLHGYIYARWPYLYIGYGKGDIPLAKKTAPLWKIFSRLFPPRVQPRSHHSLTEASHTHADGYHGKTIPLETARDLVSIKEPIRISDLEQVIPYTRARAILQEFPDHIIALDCPCRVVKANPCTPVDVCLIIGEPFASFIAEHIPEKSRWITQAEALQILEEENQRGHVHHAFFKEAMLDRFYAICNCCACCCGAMQFHQKGIPMLASSGYVADIDLQLCENCGSCQDFCQFTALNFDSTGQNQVNWNLCMGCGICVEHCPQNAIRLHLDPLKGVPLSISAS